MKYIKKGSEPLVFTKWKKRDSKFNYKILSEGTTRESVQIKQSVLQALIEDQGYICCYCECLLKEGDYHIEHLVPQAKTPNRSLDFLNMLCSCQGQLKAGQNLHCGRSKENWYQEDLFVSPLDPSCETRFKFMHDGQIKPADLADTAAAVTIEKLKLNIDKLKAQRRSALSAFIADGFTEIEFKEFVFGYLCDKEDNNGRYNEFYTTVKSLFEVQ